MRGEEKSQHQLFSYVPIESRIPEDHPLRDIRGVVDVILGEMNRKFESIYSRTGRPSIPPELRDFTVRSHPISSERSRFGTSVTVLTS